MRQRRAICRLVTVLLGFLFAGHIAAQQTPTPAVLLLGHVLDQENRRPVAGALVRIDGEGGASAVTDALGRFTISGAPAGRNTVIVEMLGYATRSDSMMLRAGQTNEIVITLTQKAVPLTPIEVSVRSGWLQASGFYEREESSPGGSFFSRDDIEKKQPNALTDILQIVPMVRVYTLDPGRRHVRLNRPTNDTQAFSQAPGGLPGCEPDLYLDGQLFRENNYVGQNPGPGDHKVDAWDIVNVSEIEGIEVYSGTRAPLQYQNACGVVLVWTRRGNYANTAPKAAPPAARPAVSITPGTLARATTRFGHTTEGVVQTVNPDSIALQTGADVHNFAIPELRRLERDGGIAGAPERMYRGAKWGFFLGLGSMAIGAMAEEAKDLGNGRTGTISAHSPRKPAFAMGVIGGSTVLGAFLGGTLWRYRHWEEVRIH